MSKDSGQDWFVGAICARRPRNVDITLDWLEDGITYEAELYADDLSDLRPFDVAEGAMPPADEALCAKMMAITPMREYLHQHRLHNVRIEKFEVLKGHRLFVPLSVNGGFALYLTPKK